MRKDSRSQPVTMRTVSQARGQVEAAAVAQLRRAGSVSTPREDPHPNQGEQGEEIQHELIDQIDLPSQELEQVRVDEGQGGPR